MRLGNRLNVPAFMLLMVVYNRGGKTASDGSKILNITYSTVRHINDSLIKIGWATSKPIDKKSIAISLTDKGREVAYSVNIMLEKMGIFLKDN